MACRFSVRPCFAHSLAYRRTMSVRSGPTVIESRLDRKLMRSSSASAASAIRFDAQYLYVESSPFTYRSIALSRSRSEEHTSELQSLMRISYAVFCLKKKRERRHNTQFIRHIHH